MFVKSNDEVDERYLAHIRTLPCLICERPSIVHHQPKRHHGKMGGKCSDYRAVPLCNDHHNGNGTPAQPGSYHQNPHKFWDLYRIDIETEIARLVGDYFFA